MKAIGILETKEMGLGYLVADAAVKAAPVTLVEAKPICPGWFFILLNGEPSAVKSAVQAGAQVAGRGLIAKDAIYKLSDAVIEALDQTTIARPVKSLGFIETRNLVAGIHLADLAVKSGRIDLLRLRRVVGSAGKSLLVFTGETAAVGQAIQSVKQDVCFQQFGVSAYMIAAPNQAIIEQL